MPSTPRKEVFIEGEVGVYHCYNRTVRQGFLCGRDAATGRDYSDRRDWIVDFQRELAALFAIEVCRYAVLANHFHTILRVRPDIAQQWSDEEVVRRWLTITHLKRSQDGRTVELNPHRMRQELSDPERVAAARRRLAHISDFMGALCEYVARRANREDGCKGHFWEGRFGCTCLMHEGAMLVCAIYVDLNQIRAGEARTPEESRYTSAYEQILAWQHRETAGTTDAAGRLAEGTPGTPISGVRNHSPADWLCELTLAADAPLSTSRPVPSASGRRASDRGLLPLSESDYLRLLDVTGRIVRADKAGAIPADLPPILERLKQRGIHLNADAWGDAVCSFREQFGAVIGDAAAIAERALQQGRSWFRGIHACRRLFA